MKETDIVEGGVYKGPGEIFIREVDHIGENTRVRNGQFEKYKFVHWITPGTWPLRTKSGRTYWTPNGLCTLKTFARWAKERVDMEPTE